MAAALLTAAPAQAAPYVNMIGSVHATADSGPAATGTEPAPPAEVTPPVAEARPVPIPEINFHETDLMNVFEILSTKADIRIDPKGQWNAPVTLSLKDVDFWQVLTFLAKLHGLAYTVGEDGHVSVFPEADFETLYGHAFDPGREVKIVPLKYHPAGDVAGQLERLKGPEGHIFTDEDNRQLILVDTPDALGRMMDLVRSVDTPVLITKVFHLKYQKPQQLFGKLSPELTPNVGRLEYGEDGSSLKVTDTPEQMDHIGTVLASLDQEVEIKFRVQILRIQLNEEHQDGIDWEAIVSRYVSFPTYGDSPSGTPEESRLSFGTITRDDLPVLKDALEAAGQLTDINEFDAVGTVGRETDWAFDTQNVPEPGRDPKGFAMTVEVTPEVLEDASYTLHLVPHLQWLSTNPPSVKTTEAGPFRPGKDVDIRLDPSDVLVVGGLLREEEIEQTSKFPLLGDLPLLGFIFRSENRLIHRTEYIIFVIPEKPQNAS